MIIKQIHIVNFKNHQNFKLHFEKNVVCFVGLNGMGKTNLLDAIYFSCVGKSYFSSQDSFCMKENESFFRIETHFENDKIEITQAVGKRKKIVFNDIAITKLSQYIGHFPVVVIAPDDNVLILGGSEERRKFVNMALAQTDKNYFESLQTYEKVLDQRNALLKQAEYKPLDTNLLAIYDQKLAPLAQYIYEKRTLYIAEIALFFQKALQEIAAINEKVEIRYKTALNTESMQVLLQKSVEKDKLLKRTNVGIHKDDFDFTLNGKSLKNYGSQGQQKSFLLALKLAQHHYLQAKLNKKAFFIIDDIFDKLDQKRSENLVKFVSENVDQVFISHTNEKTLHDKVKGMEYQIVSVN